MSAVPVGFDINGMSEGTKDIKTKDINEAAFYMMYGGEFVKARRQVLPVNKINKKGFRDEWSVYVNNVPEWVIASWRDGIAYSSITRFAYYRVKLKKLIKKAFKE